MRLATYFFLLEHLTAERAYWISVAADATSRCDWALKDIAGENAYRLYRQLVALEEDISDCYCD